MSFAIFANLLVMAGLIMLLYYLQKRNSSFTLRVFTALSTGILFGGCLQFIYSTGSDTISHSSQWFSIIGKGYVRCLKMIVVPLVMVSVISSILKLKQATSLGRISSWVLGLLMLTVSIAAVIGIMAALGFGLNAETITTGSKEISRGQDLANTAANMNGLSIPDMLTTLIPYNPFLDMTGARPTSIIGVVIFSVFVGIASLGLGQQNPEITARFERGIEVAHAVVMRIVKLVLQLTPFGILALITNVVATSNIHDILQLIRFIAASYTALISVFAVHLILVMIAGGSPIRFIKKIWPVLTFAFSSRSSAGTMPLSIQTLTQKLGVSESIANFAVSFGTTIGQNGCAGIYPAMLAVMIAPTVGIDPTSLSFIGTLVITVAIGSFGVAGVGGGATFAALIVLSALGLPVELAGLLISIEPLIDMGRTAINVSGAMTVGFVSGKAMGQVDMAIFNRDESPELNSGIIS
ncbi:L-cystine uptake protein TcyP [invertebrate metagenome]|uniref:L-cystine uptake protein TcyP n=1 Tax=invertebrate metagenome TaxID=1711999 RepID=A0A2H9TAU1_9ZZZZ